MDIVEREAGDIGRLRVMARRERDPLRRDRMRLPENITVLYLPPYSPELNPVERLWAYLRQHYLSNRVFDDYQHLLDAGARAWRELTPETLRSVCRCDYLPREGVW